MSRKDFQLIADVLKDQRSHASSVELWRIDQTARAFADALAADNPRFDRAKFLAACGVES